MEDLKPRLSRTLLTNTIVFSRRNVVGEYPVRLLWLGAPRTPRKKPLLS
jgi:hypothetical protein